MERHSLPCTPKRGRTRSDFTAQRSDKEAIEKAMEKPETAAETELFVAMLWSRTFNLPPNDERLSRLTIGDALEQIYARQALDEAVAKRIEDARKKQEEGETESNIRTDDKARAIADAPMLTGDPEFDAVELAETAEDREPLKVQM